MQHNVLIKAYEQSLLYVLLGSATGVLWNDTSNDDGVGNFRAASPVENVQWTFLPEPAESKEENFEEDYVEAVHEEGYGQVDNVLKVVPSSTIPNGGTSAVTQPGDTLPQPSSSSTDDCFQVPEEVLEVPYRRMTSFIRSISEIDGDTLIKRHRGTTVIYVSSTTSIDCLILRSISFTIGLL